MDTITITSAEGIDPLDLAAMRVAAMKPSLEAVGRFDPERARNRFLESYQPEDTSIIRER